MTQDHNDVDNSGGSPSQGDVFAASPPFVHAGDGFRGADGFNPAGPQPVFAPVGPPGLEASCLDVHRSLSVYLDGELAPLQDAAVQAHLGGCGSCQAAQAFQMQLRSTVAAKAFDPMPEDVRDRITRALGFD